MSIYAVNGKVPVAAWIPSRDTAGNGTTTLNDLVGSNHGTLTNMDAATDWVADTGAGGVRALDFDRVNDFVRVNQNAVINLSVMSFSAWIFNISLAATEFTIIASKWSHWGGNSSNEWHFSCRNTSKLSLFTTSGSELLSSANVPLGSWVHVVFTVSGGTATFYINGSFDTSGAFRSITAGSSAISIGDSIGRAINRMDDIRIFNTALDASDVAYLYNSGNGRGRIAAPTNRNNALIGVGF